MPTQEWYILYTGLVLAVFLKFRNNQSISSGHAWSINILRLLTLVINERLLLWILPLYSK